MHPQYEVAAAWKRDWKVAGQPSSRSGSGKQSGEKPLTPQGVTGRREGWLLRVGLAGQWGPDVHEKEKKCVPGVCN